MGNSIFNKLNGGLMNNGTSNNFLQFVDQIRQSGISPEQTVRQLLSSGRMTQEQFNQFSQIANQLTGRK